MKRFLLILICLLLCIPAFAEDNSTCVGTWIETEGYGTLTIRLDGTATMVYYDGTEMDTTWSLTDDGYRFGDGMWYNSPMELLDENTLSVSDGWMIFAREGFLPTTDPALLLGAEPVGEEGEPYFGQWQLTALIMEGEEIDPALLGVTMTLTFHEDGTAVSDDGWEPYTTTWYVDNGFAIVEFDVLYIDEENDQLIFDQEGDSMVFTRVVEKEEPADVSDAPEVSGASDVVGSDLPVPTAEESAPFLGDWYLAAITLDGETMNPALFGIQMNITFFEEGLALLEEDGETETVSWAVQDGAAVIADIALTLTDDGLLVMADAEGEMIFARLGEENPFGFTEPSELEQWLALLQMMGAASDWEEEDLSHMTEGHQPFVGTWYLCYVATGGLTGDLRALGVTGELALYSDYSGTLSGIADEYGSWYEEDGVIRFGESGMAMFIVGDEWDVYLQYGTEAGGYMIFSQDEYANWTPGLYPLAGSTPAAEAPANGAPAASASGAIVLEAKYVCKTYTTAGFTMDAATLGAEYAVIFHANGTADFTLAGFTVTALPYSVADGIHAIDYYGTPFNCTPTDAGFDMDYYGAMMMHFVPAE
ncbi:MAG: hypothetical protein IJE07_10790 [Clostridia bacterium]|nr:hypothetical protein [Clostridia bacterium]